MAVLDSVCEDLEAQSGLNWGRCSSVVAGRVLVRRAVERLTLADGLPAHHERFGRGVFHGLSYVTDWFSPLVDTLAMK